MLVEDEFDLGFDDNCYEISCSLLTMWYLRALKAQKTKEKMEKNITNKNLKD